MRFDHLKDVFGTNSIIFKPKIFINSQHGKKQNICNIL